MSTRRKGGWATPACLVAGVLASQLFSSLPATGVIVILTLAGLILMVPAGYRWLGLSILACSWCLWSYHFRLLDRLQPALSGEVVAIEGKISSIPQAYSEYVRFRFSPDSSDHDVALPGTLLVHWYQNWPELSVGQRWRLELKLKPPWGSVNFQGTDKERWLFAQGIGGLGTVRGGKLLAPSAGQFAPVQKLRERIIRHVALSVPNRREQAIVQALATAERSGMAEADRQLLTLTGTSHLLAISGLHIGLAAAGGMWVSRLLLWFLPLLRAGSAPFMISMACGLLSAMAYSALAGLGIPTLRAVLMLLVLMSAFMLRRSIHPFRAWLLALALILISNPFAMLGAGFWFSFLAVAALMAQFVPRTGVFPWWKTLLMAQLAVMLVLLPVSAVWFHSFSLLGFFANLVAIPWVSLIVVPFVLAGLASLPASIDLAAACWSVAAYGSFLLLQFLEALTRLHGQLVFLPTPGRLHLLCAILGGFLLLLPKGVTGRWAGIFLLAPLFMPPGERTRAGSLEVEVLDAGQGTSVIVSTKDRSLLYDTGPGDGNGRDMVGGVIAPALDRLGGTAPERVIVSHADLDHAGGLRSVLDRYPGARYFNNHPDEPRGIGGCKAPMEWSWQGAQFNVLHPSPGLSYRGNDSSCVLSVRIGKNSMLLTGDISNAVESRLLAEQLAPHRILLVPHHGSMTSSGEDFIKRLQPEISVATAGLGNRFNFPRQEVRQRILASGSEFWSTGECGAIRLVLNDDGSSYAVSARRLRNRIWRWPVADHCP